MKEVLLLLFCFNFMVSHAKEDNGLYQKEERLKLSYNEYVNDFANDDTTRAIIQLYFNKRDNNAGGKMSFLPVSAAVTVAVPPVGLVLMGISTPLFVGGVITKSKYSHKKLQSDLHNYNTLKVMTPKLRRQVKKILFVEKELEDDLNERYVRNDVIVNGALMEDYSRTSKCDDLRLVK